jgi:hypothetical protein
MTASAASARRSVRVPTERDLFFIVPLPSFRVLSLRAVNGAGGF